MLSLFLDSLNYISASLDSAVADHKLRNQEFKITKQSDLVKNSRGEFCEKRFSLVEEAKGVFCYSYLSSFGKQIFFFFARLCTISDLWQSLLDRLYEKKLPKKKHFYSSLSRKHITDHQYSRAKTFYKTFKCQNIGEYCMVKFFIHRQKKKIRIKNKKYKLFFFINRLIAYQTPYF